MAKKSSKRPKEKLEQFALAVTRGVGSLESILVHTLLFLFSFLAVEFGVVPFERMLLILTTIVSLEAIYLSIFIQMSINYTSASLEGVEQDIEEIQEDIDEIQEDVDEIQEDVDEIQEDVEEMTEDEKQEEALQVNQDKTLDEIRVGLQKLMSDVEKLHNRP